MPASIARSSFALLILVATASSLAAQDTSVDAHVPRMASGVTAGSLRYAGGRTEDALSAVVALRPAHGLSVNIEPTFARASEPSGTGGGRVLSTSGLTDVPIALAWEHPFGGLLAGTVELSFGATLPVGSTATGFGTGTLGTSYGVGGDISPSEKLTLFASAGHALSSVTAQSALNGGSGGWGDVGASYQVGSRVALLAGYSTDLGAVDTAYGRGRSVSTGLSYTVAGPFALNVEASRGISGATPQWSAVVGVGTAFGSLDGARALRTAFGGGRHGLKSRTSSTVSRGRGRA